jgi:hypothetical protein
MLELLDCRASKAFKVFKDCRGRKAIPEQLELLELQD